MLRGHVSRVNKFLHRGQRKAMSLGTTKMMPMCPTCLSTQGTYLDGASCSRCTFMTCHILGYCVSKERLPKGLRLGLICHRYF